MKKCSHGYIILFLIIAFVTIFFLFYHNTDDSLNNEPRETNINTTIQMSNPYYRSPDVLKNPYDAPLKDDRYNLKDDRYNLKDDRYNLNTMPINSVPINVSTVAVDTEYRQLGILTPLQGSSKDNILALMGRPLYIRRSKFNYYTISNQHNNVKLPVTVGGRSALSDIGVDELFSGDSVYVEGNNEAFKVTIYENSLQKYLPFF
jgi:hypothetical protein